MAIKIHHGPNGSYKTSGAVLDDVIPAIKQGRVIITNIRGMTAARCRETFPNAPASFDLVALDMDTADGLERCRTFFQWAPPGALIIFDETQLLFLKAWKPTDLKRFDHPGGPEAAQAENVPASWLDAWTRHRHWNWDIVLTTPNIKYIRDDIRLTCEGAFKHSNLGLLGPVFKRLIGDYKEAFHDAQLNVPPPKAITKFRRIPKTVWNLYDSTATGVVKDTSAGTSILSSIPLVTGIAIIAFAIIYALSSDGLDWFVTSDPVDHQAAVGVNSQEIVDALGVDVLPSQPVTPDPVDSPMAAFLKAHAISVTGIMDVNGRKTVEFIFSTDNAEFPLNSADLAKQGVAVTIYSNCLVSIEYQDQFGKLVSCRSTILDPPDTLPVSM